MAVDCRSAAEVAIGIWLSWIILTCRLLKQGQPDQIAAENYAEAASRLLATVRDVAVLAESVMIVANSSVERPRIRRERRR